MAIAINKKANEAYGFTASDGKVYYYGDLAAREAIKAGVNLVSVAELPAASEDTMGKIYLVPASREGIDKNVKAEYVTIKAGTAEAPVYSWEKIGDTNLDLSGYSKVGHTHKVTSNVEVADAEYTPEGENAASDVTFAEHTSDNALGEGTTFTNAASEVTGSAAVEGGNQESDVTFDIATEGHTAQAITGIGASTVPAYKLGDETKQKMSATASGVDVNTEKKLVVADASGVGSVVAGSDAELSEGAQASFGTEVDENGIVSFNFTANTLQTLSGGKATQVTLPTFAEQTIATSIKSQPTVALSLGAEGDVDVVTGQGALSIDGTNNVTFGEMAKKEVLSKDVTAKAAAQAWAQTKGEVTGTAAAQVITVGENDKVAALTALGKATAAGQVFTGSKATLHHDVTNNEVTTGADIAPQA